MATRAGSSPVQVVARAARYRTLRSMLAAVGAVIVTTLVVTAALVWPVGEHGRAACAPDKTSVSVYPFQLSFDVSGGWSPSGASDSSGSSGRAKEPGDTSRHSARSGQRPRVSGCVATTDLTPANPHASDGRG